MQSNLDLCLATFLAVSDHRFVAVVIAPKPHRVFCFPSGNWTDVSLAVTAISQTTPLTGTCSSFPPDQRSCNNRHVPNEASSLLSPSNGALLGSSLLPFGARDELPSSWRAHGGGAVGVRASGGGGTHWDGGDGSSPPVEAWEYATRQGD